MNGDDRERAELEEVYNRLLETHYANLLELGQARDELNRERAEKTETIGKKEQKINELNDQLAKENKKIQALRNKLQNLRKGQSAEQISTEPQTNRGINHYQQNRRAYQGAALTGLLITGGIAGNYLNSGNFSRSNFDSDSSVALPSSKIATERDNCQKENQKIKGDLATAHEKSELTKIGQLEEENREQQEQINDLKLRPVLKDYQDLQNNYNSLNTTHHNYQGNEIEQAGLTKKTEYERVKAERDSRPEITLPDYQKLEVQKTLTGTQKERDKAQAGLEDFNQQLNEVQQELVRSQRKERKLAQTESKLQKQIEELKANKSTNQTTITDLTTQLENKQQEAVKLHEEIASQKESKNYLQALLNSLLGGLVGYAGNGKNVSEQEIKEIAKEVNNLREHVCLSYPKDYESLKADKDKLIQEITLVKNERDKAIGERND
ncbi:8244_t:CDS:2 [Entrophospora sp. SA101]|nr:8244_t:CDS:2 [Entrophospora sp. SA101]